MEEVRNALDVEGEIPIVRCDARRPDAAKHVLETLLEHVLALT